MLKTSIKICLPFIGPQNVNLIYGFCTYCIQQWNIVRYALYITYIAKITNHQYLGRNYLLRKYKSLCFCIYKLNYSVVTIESFIN